MAMFALSISNISAVSFALKVSTPFVLCKFLLNEVLEATEKQGFSYFVCQDLRKNDFSQVLAFLAWSCARFKLKIFKLNDKFTVPW